MKASPFLSHFNGGEVDELFYGRSDHSKYASSLQRCYNAFPLIQGPWMRRTGTRFVGDIKSNLENELIPFIFSTTQAYVLEFTNLAIRFWADFGSGPGQVLSGLSPYEIVSPYPTAVLAELKYTQSADVLYIFHPDYPVYKVIRTGHTAWTIAQADWIDGPYLPTNAGPTTLTFSAGTCTASAVAGINGGIGFQATDVGRPIRIKGTTNWFWANITAVASTTSVSIDSSDSVSATIEWRLGLWSGTTGYPSTGAFYQDRLALAGSTSNPQRVDLSRSGDFESFAPSDADGTVADDSAIGISLQSNQVNAIRWLIDDERGLLLGTTGGEWIVGQSSTNQPISPTNVRADRPTSVGSLNSKAIRAEKTTLFIDRDGRSVQEFGYDFQVDGFIVIDHNKLAPHITYSTIDKLAHQRIPHRMVWARRLDGKLVAMTFDRDEGIDAWSEHDFGGEVESITVIPSPDGLRDVLWMSVKRTIDGNVVRYVETLDPYWEKGMDQEDAFFVDCGLSYDGVATTSLSGLDHLEGETVTILADGSVHPDRVVTFGAITLARFASVVHVGLRYLSEGQTLPIEAGASDGTAHGKTKRIHRVHFRLYDSLGLQTGTDFDNLYTHTFRTTSDAMDTAVPLYNGIIEVPWESLYDKLGVISWRQVDPLPLTIVWIAPQLVTQDR